LISSSLFHFDQIVFVCNNNDLNGWHGVLVNFFEPIIKIQERLSVKQIEAKNYSVSTFIVGISNGSVSLLTSSVPNLKLDLLATMSQRSESEINANCRHVILVELVISESNEEARFAYARISKEDHLKKVVVIFT